MTGPAPSLPPASMSTSITSPTHVPTSNSDAESIHPHPRSHSHSHHVPPAKRICTSPRISSSMHSKAPVLRSMQAILQMPEDAVWGLRKQDLRAHFLALQKYARNPYALPAPTATPTATATVTPCTPREPSATSTSTLPFALTTASIHSAPSPLLLRLPSEIRQLIYTFLLPAPSDPPLRGPHPRQLQNHILLTQPIPTNILLLNHQIRSEALPLLYGCSTQTIHVTVDYNIWLHKTQRSDLVLSSELTSSIKHIHISVHLGNEKRTSKPGEVEADARIAEVRKGVKKLGKWLSGANLQSLRISWQEPPQTFTWEQKRFILDGMRVLRAVKVDTGEINWGLNWNKGRRYRFELEYLKELERPGG